MARQTENTIRHAIAAWLALSLLLVAGTAAAADLTGVDHAIQSTDNRDGYMYEQSATDCPPAAVSTATNTTTTNNTLYWNAGITLSRRYRAYWSFDLTNISEPVDSARVRLVVSSTASTNWNTDSDFYYDDCAIGGDCTSALNTGGGDWTVVTNALITIPWGDMAAANDSIFLSVTAEQLGVGGASHTFDLNSINAKEADVCDATGYNGVRWYTVNESTAGYKPVLYVWTSAAGGKPALLDIDASDIDLSNPPLIRRESE